MPLPVYERIHPLRRPPGFEPVVQRWSVAFTNDTEHLCVAFHGVQGPDASSVYASPFLGWITHALTLPTGPSVADHSWSVDANGLYTHVVATYWTDRDRRDAWLAAAPVADWWHDPDRATEPTGYFRESFTIPLDRQETLYWQDYPAGLSRAGDVAIHPTPYAGYYGAMRDRLARAAVDTLEPPVPRLGPRRSAPTEGRRVRVAVPENLAIIRSAQFWGRCDPEQTEDYLRDLREPLMRGMGFLGDHAEETGCCALRFQQTCDAAGEPVLETHALGYFLSLGDLERWAEQHPTHDAIFSAALARYRRYGSANQLRTWHEVFVLPVDGHEVEYVNCAPGTGLLGWFEAEGR